MDSYFMDQIISSYDECFWGGDSCGDSYDYYNGFDYNPNFYHYRVKFKVVHETAKAYLFEVKEGEFWCPKSLLRNIRVKNGDLRALLWDGFNPKYLSKNSASVDDFEDLGEEPVVVKKKKLRKHQKKAIAQVNRSVLLATKPNKNIGKTVISSQKEDVFTQYELEWLR